jgi:hypothetical protein
VGRSVWTAEQIGNLPDEIGKFVVVRHARRLGQITGFWQQLSGWHSNNSRSSALENPHFRLISCTIADRRQYS